MALIATIVDVRRTDVSFDIIVSYDDVVNSYSQKRVLNFTDGSSVTPTIIQNEITRVGLIIKATIANTPGAINLIGRTITI